MKELQMISSIIALSVNIKDLQSINLGNGSIVEVKSKLLKTFFDHDTVFGRVKHLGPYPALKSSLRDILNVAGGLRLDPIFKKTINDDEIIIFFRKDSNQFYSQQFIISYEDSDNFPN